MKTDHKITIITPSFNQNYFIKDTIKSVLDQDYKDLEYIIIDGGSSDGTLEIIKEYSDDLHYFVSEKDNGQSQAINKGIIHSSGSIINWLNSDDYYEPNALSIIADCFCKNEDIQVVTGKERYFESGTNKTLNIYQGTNFELSIEDLIYNAEIDQPPTFFRTDVFKKCTPLNENLHYTMDSELWMKYLLQFGKDKIQKTDHLLTNFRVHSESKSFNFQDEFLKERNTLKYYLGKTIGVPKFLLSFIEAQGINDQIKVDFSKLVFHSSISIDKLIGVFAKNIFPKFYQYGMYAEAKKAYQLYKNFYRSNYMIKDLRYEIMLNLFSQRFSNRLRCI